MTNPDKYLNKSLLPHEVTPPPPLGVFSIKCQKMQYGTGEEAMEALRVIVAQPHTGKDNVKSCYRCPKCKKWHLTKQEKR